MGAWSDSHADLKGTIAWTKHLCGQKIWWSDRPNSSSGAEPSILNLGDTIIMPPGRIHSVYTVNSSISAGGHGSSLHPGIIAATATAKRQSNGQVDTNQHKLCTIGILAELGMCLLSITYCERFGLRKPSDWTRAADVIVDMLSNPRAHCGKDELEDEDEAMQAAIEENKGLAGLVCLSLGVMGQELGNLIE